MSCDCTGRRCACVGTEHHSLLMKWADGNGAVQHANCSTVGSFRMVLSKKTRCTSFLQASEGLFENKEYTEVMGSKYKLPENGGVPSQGWWRVAALWGGVLIPLHKELPMGWWLPGRGVAQLATIWLTGWERQTLNSSLTLTLWNSKAKFFTVIPSFNQGFLVV